jgi:hypothetical protein
MTRSRADVGGIYPGRTYHRIPPLAQDTILRLLARLEADPSREGVKPADLYFGERHIEAFRQHLKELVARGYVERVPRRAEGRCLAFWYRLTPAGREYLATVSPTEAVRARRSR